MRWMLQDVLMEKSFLFSGGKEQGLGNRTFWSLEMVGKQRIIEAKQEGARGGCCNI